MTTSVDIEARFWAKVKKTEKCWLWMAPLYKGYGQFSVGGFHVGAHRYAYELLVGPIPAGLVIDHLCRVRNCVNPAHMEPVTIGENVLRGDTISARNAAKTRCLRGHPLSGENLCVYPDGSRYCRECHRARIRRDSRRRKLVAA